MQTNKDFTNEPDWELIWKVKRDICFMYHELTEYPGVCMDLAFGLIYNMPYWDYLDLHVAQMPETERNFIRDGCLIMILTMAWDVISGSGTYLVNKLSPCRRAVMSVSAEDENTVKLKQAVIAALDTVENTGKSNDELERQSAWANQTYVLGYFEDKAAGLRMKHKRA